MFDCAQSLHGATDASGPRYTLPSKFKAFCFRDLSLKSDHISLIMAFGFVFLLFLITLALTVNAVSITTSTHCILLNGSPLCPGDAPVDIVVGIEEYDIGAAWFNIQSGFAPGTFEYPDLRPKWSDDFSSRGVANREGVLVFGRNYCLTNKVVQGYQFLGCAMGCYNGDPLPNPYFHRFLLPKEAENTTPDWSNPISGEVNRFLPQTYVKDQCLNPNTAPLPTPQKPKRQPSHPIDRMYEAFLPSNIDLQYNIPEKSVGETLDGQTDDTIFPDSTAALSTDNAITGDLTDFSS